MIYVENTSNYPQTVHIPRDEGENMDIRGYQFQKKDIDIRRNGEYYMYPDPGFDAITAGTITVNVPTDTKEAYDQGYQDGYADGYNSGLADGYSSGRTEGYEEGRSEGYEQGREDGYSEGYSSGSTDGYQEGYRFGYETGYADGHADGYQVGYQDGTNHQKELLTAETFTSNGQYTLENGWSAVTISVPDGPYQEGYQDGAAHQKSLLGSLTVTANGITVTSETGYSAVTTSLPMADIRPRIDTNGVYSYIPTDFNLQGFSGLEVTVDVPTTGGTSVLTAVTATTNGVYTPPTGFDGFSSVRVDVQLDTATTYNQGYSDGYASGSTDGYSSGSTDGYSSGYTDGVNWRDAQDIRGVFEENKTYRRSNGFGWNEVVVRVPTGAGTNIPLTGTSVEYYAVNNYGTYSFNHTSANTLYRLVVYFPQTGETKLRTTYQDTYGDVSATTLIADAEDWYWVNSVSIDGGAPITLTSNTYSFGDTNEHEVVYDLRLRNRYPSFSQCSALTSIDMSELDLDDRKMYFPHCTKLRSIKMRQAKQLNTNCFGGCSNLNISIEKELPLIDSIPNQAFINSAVSGLSEYIEDIDTAAFQNCQNLRNTIDLSNVKTIGIWAFQYCYNITQVVLPSVDNYLVKGSAFRNCTALTTVVMNNAKNGTLTDSLFMGCSSLTTWIVNGESVPPTVSGGSAILTSTGTLTLNGVGQYEQTWRTWASTNLPNWTVQVNA